MNRIHAHLWNQDTVIVKSTLNFGNKKNEGSEWSSSHIQFNSISKHEMAQSSQNSVSISIL